MTSEQISTPPSVSWAQRSARIFLIFNVECEKPDIKIEKNLVSFKGTCAPEGRLHEVQIPLYDEVNPEKSIQINKGRYIELVLAKENTDTPYWPALTSDKKKHHWLKVDFNRWQDEDEEVEDKSHMYYKDDDDMLNFRMGDGVEDFPDEE